MVSADPTSLAAPSPSVLLPRVTIQFCTQCKWMLRAAYFAQELLSTFSTSLGEVALQPSTGGTFIVTLYHAASPTSSTSADAADGDGERAGAGGESGKVEIKEYLLWDRKAEGGFPETKELKKRVRDVIDPKRDLGHVDGKKKSTPAVDSTSVDHTTTTDTAKDHSITKAVSEGQPTRPTIGDSNAESTAASASTSKHQGHAASCKPGEKCEDCE